MMCDYKKNPSLRPFPSFYGLSLEDFKKAGKVQEKQAGIKDKSWDERSKTLKSQSPNHSYK